MRLAGAGRIPLVLALLVVIGAGLSPYLVYLGLGPVRDDAVIWLVRGAPSSPEWSEWGLRSAHFSAYRPVAALSYTLTSTVGGLDPAVQRAVDLALHGLVALLLALLGARVAPDRPRFVAIVAAVVFVAHPGVDEVVPFLARRSYTLATALGLAALLAFLAARPVTSGLLLAGAVLSNEIAFTTLAAMPLLALARANGAEPASGRRAVRSALAACALPLLFALSALAIRLAVLPDAGGYTFPSDWSTRAPLALVELWREAFLWRAATDGIGTPAATVLYVLVALAWTRSLAGSRRRTVAIPLFWLLAFALSLAALGAWFPRLLYPALVPFALLVAIPLARTTRTTASLVALAPQLLLVALVLVRSPVLRGPDPDRLRGERRQHALMSDLVARAAETHEPAEVLVVLPYQRTGGGRPSRAGRQITHGPIRWADFVLRERDLLLEPYLFFQEREHGTPQAFLADGRTVLELPPGQRYHHGPRGEVRRADGTRGQQLEIAPGPRGRRRYVYVFARGAGSMTAVDGG